MTTNVNHGVTRFTIRELFLVNAAQESPPDTPYKHRRISSNNGLDDKDPERVRVEGTQLFTSILKERVFPTTPLSYFH